MKFTEGRQRVWSVLNGLGVETNMSTFPARKDTNKKITGL